ncbi:MAG: hypothetical protein GXY14_05090 [Spirochaetes bacterium]|nr:hypothetical protein [Spirochaetota bacterium]
MELLKKYILPRGKPLDGGIIRVDSFTRERDYDIMISQYLIDMLPYLVTIIILVIVSMRKKGKGSAPAGLGVPYFREER